MSIKMTVTSALLVKSLIAAHRQSRRYAAQLQAQWLAEAGLARARAQLAARPDYAGETWQAPVGSAETEIGQVTIRVEAEGIGKPRLLVVEAAKDDPAPRAARGGAFASGLRHARAAARFAPNPRLRRATLGLRVARTFPDPRSAG